MRFFDKHKKFISRLLVVTVSLMMILSFNVCATSLDTSGLYNFNLSGEDCKFKSYTIDGKTTSSVAKGYSFSFTAPYGSYSNFDVTCNLQSSIYISPSTFPKKVICFNVEVPLGLVENYGEDIVVAFSTNLGNDFKLNYSSSILHYKHIGDHNLFGYLSLLSFRVDYSRLKAMNEYAGNFYITGVRIKLSNVGASEYLGWGNRIYLKEFKDCKQQTIIDESAEMIAEALQPLFSFLGSFVADAFSFVVDTLLIPVIDAAALMLGDILETFEPFFNTFFNDLLMPVLDSLLSNVKKLSTTLVSSLTPVIEGIIDFFAPYFNNIVTAISTNFVDFAEDLTPILNEFIKNITPSFNSIVTNLSDNIKLIINECFIPDNESEQVQEFVAIKDKLLLKVPVFSQFGDFLSSLFNPDTYNASSSIQETSYISISSIKKMYYTLPNKLPNGRYKLVLSMDDSYSLSNYGYVVLQCKKSNVKVYNYFAQINFSALSTHKKNITSTFEITDSNSYDSMILKFVFEGSARLYDVRIYSLDNTVLSSNIVSYKGKSINAFNFDWYKPYKHYGDILIISFCYLAFVWRTYKKLPTMV